MMTRENKVSVEKVRIKPVTVPRGWDLLPVSELDKIRGRIGKIHGEKINARPSMKANKMLMRSLYNSLISWLLL